MLTLLIRTFNFILLILYMGYISLGFLRSNYKISEGDNVINLFQELVLFPFLSYLVQVFVLPLHTEIGPTLYSIFGRKF